MIHLFRGLLYIALTYLAMLLSKLGFMWMDEGYGLNPAVAFPIATLAVVGLGVLLVIEYHIYRQRCYRIGEWAMKEFK